MTFPKFRVFIQKNRSIITVKGVKARWPYNYHNNIGYLVTLRGQTRYFFFNNTGTLLTNTKETV